MRAPATAGTSCQHRRARRNALPLRADGRPARSRPGLALSARGRARPERGDRSRAPIAGATAMARPAVGGRGALRAARRRVHAGGHLPRGDRQARPSGRPRRDGDRAHAGRRFSRPRELGLRRRLPFAPDASYGRPEDLKAFVDAAHARGLDGPARRRLQPLRAGGELSLALSRRTSSPTGIKRPGARRSTSMARTPDRCAISSSRTRSTGSRSSISTGCGSTPSTRSTTTANSIFSRNSRSGCASLRRDRLVHLILENEENGATPARARRGRRAAALHRAVERRHPSCRCMSRRPARMPATTPTMPATRDQLGRALAEGFAFQGEMMPYRGTPRGEPSAGTCRRPPSSPSSRTTTRSATAPSANG